MMLRLVGKALFLALAVGLVTACAGAPRSADPTATSASSAASATQPAASQSVPAATGTPATQSGARSEAGAPVACARLILPDELKVISGMQPAALQEETRPGSTTCLWSYTPKGASQEAHFEVRVAAAAVEAWNQARM